MKSVRHLLIAFIAVVLLLGTFSAGILIGWAIPGGPDSALGFLSSDNALSSSSSQELSDQSETPEDLKALFNPFWETWTIIHDIYVDQPVDDVEMMRGAISGMLDSLGDQHTSYMPPILYEEQNATLEGQEYEGIGAWVDITGDYLMIISPMPGSPAEGAGLQPNDLVVAVDGKDMTGKDGDTVLSNVLGPAGTTVVLTIQRGDPPEVFDVSIVRTKIVVPSINASMLDENIAYIQLYNFGENTTKELRESLKELLEEDPDGLILDLRNNGGGYLTTAIEVSSEFIKFNQVVMYEEFGDGTRTTYKAKRGGLATDIPLVVLVNEGTASASEITAGAIQDYKRGLLVGTTTFGKGSVQNWISLSDNQGGIRVTTARWLTPLERRIHRVGLEPDFKVGFTEEDAQKGIDPQLEKAIEVIEAMK